MKLFINENDCFTIDLYIYQDSNDLMHVWSKNIKDNFVECEQEKIHHHSVVFKQPVFSDHVDIADAAKNDIEIPNDQRDTMIGLYRIVKLIKSWTFVDENNQIVKPDSDAILKLHPRILSVIISELRLIFD